jgi:hypothetical protein
VPNGIAPPAWPPGKVGGPRHLSIGPKWAGNEINPRPLIDSRRTRKNELKARSAFALREVPQGQIPPRGVLRGIFRLYKKYAKNGPIAEKSPAVAIAQLDSP